MSFQKLTSFFKAHAVLCIAAAAAVLSCFFVPPDMQYFSYPDYKVLGLLFCLMASVAGLQKANVFSLLSDRIGHKVRSVRMMGLFLTLLCFFCSMFVTNDVALIAFVPFAILMLNAVGRRDLIIFTVTMQTIAANLGSMATPVGNPQNLYLYERYKVPAGHFFTLTLPVVGASLLLLCVCWLFVKNAPVSMRHDGEIHLQRKELIVCAVLFVLCLLCVLRVLDYRILLGIVVAALLVFDRKLFAKVDYGLLVTFLAFFVFVGNLTRIPAVSEWLSALLQKAPFWISVGCSQVISNVPAAILLSGFTDAADALILGTNVGGLGTLIASLASLISFGLYARQKDADTGKYLLVFTGMNLLFLAVLCPLSLLLQ